MEINIHKILKCLQKIVRRKVNSYPMNMSYQKNCYWILQFIFIADILSNKFCHYLKIWKNGDVSETKKTISSCSTYIELTDFQLYWFVGLLNQEYIMEISTVKTKDHDFYKKAPCQIKNYIKRHNYWQVSYFQYQEYDITYENSKLQIINCQI